jgi:inhibitor of KinA
MWRIDPAGDRSVLVRLGTSIEPALLAKVLALDRALSEGRIDGILGTVPAYASLLCRYDPSVLQGSKLEDKIRSLEISLQPSELSGEVSDIPTVYDGPDLAAVAENISLSPDEVVELHAAREYLVYCIGFAPGFTYCGALDVRLSVPRKASPRARVAAGSVAIAGRQTGIYAVDSPGGWNILGRTELQLFDASQRMPARFKPGDRVRFVPR